MKKILFIPAALIFLASCNGGYEGRFKKTFKAAKHLSSEAAGAVDEVAETWRSAISDKQYNHNGHAKSVYDFNDALMMLAGEKDVTDKRQVLDSLNDDLKKQMTGLQDPPEKYKEAYNEMLTLYTATSELARMGISPDGSFTSYRTKVDGAVSTIIGQIKELEVRVPSLQEEDNKK